MAAIFLSYMEASYIPLYFSLLSLPSNFTKPALPFYHGLTAHMHLGYQTQKHTAKITCADSPE